MAVVRWLALHGKVKIMLLHDSAISNNDGIKAFFGEIHQLYVKSLLNPFYIPGKPIKSLNFRSKVRPGPLPCLPSSLPTEAVCIQNLLAEASF